MKYGRVDASGPEDCPEEGRLPGKASHLSALPLVLRITWLYFGYIILSNFCTNYCMFALMFDRCWSSFTCYSSQRSFLQNGIRWQGDCGWIFF